MTRQSCAGRRSTLIASMLIGILVSASMVSAGTFTVTLTNGTSFETRYRPASADWDDNLVLLSTDRGNQIALLKTEIADITSSVEESGFGYQLDTTTLFVGWSPLDAPEEGEDGGAGQDGSQGQAFDAPPPSFSVEQFVNPGDTFGGDLPAYTGYGPQSTGLQPAGPQPPGQ